MYPTDQNTPNALSKVPEALSKGTSGIIILPQNPSQDAIGAACSLYLALAKFGKNVTIACSSPIQGEFIGADKIQANISTGGDNLVISFPFKEEGLDKVDYGFQGDFFNVIVTPRPGQPKLQPSNVKFSYTGGNLDFIITIDAPNLNSLGAIYQENQNEFAGKTIINIDRHLVNDQFGTVNYVVKTASSTSELVFKIIQALQIQLDKEIATNLYSGIMAATNNFTSYSVNAETFGAASTLLQAGAMKRPATRPGAQGLPPMPGMNNPMMQGMPQRRPMPPMMPPMDDFDDEDDEFDDEMPLPPMPRMAPQPMNRPAPNPFDFPQQGMRPQPMQPRMAPQMPQQPMPQAPMQMPQQPRPQSAPQQVPPPQMNTDVKPIEDVEVQPGATPEEASQAPQDWLKPKIFKGGGGLV